MAYNIQAEFWVDAMNILLQKSLDAQLPTRQYVEAAAVVAARTRSMTACLWFGDPDSARPRPSQGTQVLASHVKVRGETLA